MAGLYIHIPFCLRQCFYCDFYVEPLGTGPLSQRFKSIESTSHATFIQCLKREWELAPNKSLPETIYLGGGTPTELAAADLKELLQFIPKSQAAEITCEANPGTLTKDKAELLKSSGVNRISLGAQSFNPKTLEFLTRIHGPEEIVDTYELLRETDFSNINLDLIFGIPHTTLKEFETDLHRMIELSPEHISCYSLDYEPHTQITHMIKSGHLKELDHEVVAAQFYLAHELLTEAGYLHYEISNYAKPGFEAQHNLKTWHGGEYLGLGPSAASHINGERFRNKPNLKQYQDAISRNELPRIEHEKLEGAAKARELFFINMRLLEGVHVSDFEAKTGFTLAALYPTELEQLLADNLLEEVKGHLRMTSKAYVLSNSVFEELV